MFYILKSTYLYRSRGYLKKKKIIYFFLNNKSFKETHRTFKEKFGYHYTVPYSITNQTVCWFPTEHTTTHRKGSKKLPIITLKRKEEVMEAVSANSCVSVHCLALHARLSRATTHHILHSLMLKPYRIAVQQELQAAAYTKHIRL